MKVKNQDGTVGEVEYLDSQPLKFGRKQGEQISPERLQAVEKALGKVIEQRALKAEERKSYALLLSDRDFINHDLRVVSKRGLGRVLEISIERVQNEKDLGFFEAWSMVQKERPELVRLYSLAERILDEQRMKNIAATMRKKGWEKWLNITPELLRKALDYIDQDGGSANMWGELFEYLTKGLK